MPKRDSLEPCGQFVCRFLLVNRETALQALRKSLRQLAQLNPVLPNLGVSFSRQRREFKKSAPELLCHLSR